MSLDAKLSESSSDKPTPEATESNHQAPTTDHHNKTGINADSNVNLSTSPPEAHPQTQSSLLRLPAELRTKIWRELFRDTFIAVLKANEPAPRNQQPQEDGSTHHGKVFENARPKVIIGRGLRAGLGLLPVCRKIHPEAVEALFNMAELGVTNGALSLPAYELVNALYPRVPGVPRVADCIRMGRMICGGYRPQLTTRGTAEGGAAGDGGGVGGSRMFGEFKGISALARFPALTSVVIATGWEMLVNQETPDQRVHAVRLERALRAQSRKLAAVRVGCVWMNWPQYPEAFDMEEDGERGRRGGEDDGERGMPRQFMVHRLHYSLSEEGKVWELVHEDAAGNVIQVRRPCPWCQDAILPWDGKEKSQKDEVTT